jgi:hypothetical protein
LRVQGPARHVLDSSDFDAAPLEWARDLLRSLPAIRITFGELTMFERELTLYKFNLNYLRLLAADIEEAQMQECAFPGANPPIWILGHLAVSTDYAGRILGLERACPREWHVKFAPGSKPAELQPPLPTKDELLAAIENGHRRVAEALPNASAEALNKPHEVELLRPTVLKTVGDVLGHLMCTHAAFHLAQLSACRRKSGKAHVV